MTKKRLEDLREGLRRSALLVMENAIAFDIATRWSKNPAQTVFLLERIVAGLKAMTEELAGLQDIGFGVEGGGK